MKTEQTRLGDGRENVCLINTVTYAELPTYGSGPLDRLRQGSSWDSLSGQPSPITKSQNSDRACPKKQGG